MLTYESASELLHLNLEEEVELKILSEAAALRLQWRLEQVIKFNSKINHCVEVLRNLLVFPNIHIQEP